MNSNQIKKIREIGGQIGTLFNTGNTYYNTFDPTVNVLEPVVSTMLTYASSKRNEMPVARGAIVPFATRHRKYTKGYHHHRVRRKDIAKSVPRQVVKKSVKKGNPRRYVNTETYKATFGNRVETLYKTHPDDTVISLMNTYITMYHSDYGTFRRTTTTTGTAVRSIGQTGFGQQNKTWEDTIYHYTVTDTNGDTHARTHTDSAKAYNIQPTEKYNTSSFSPGQTILPDWSEKTQDPDISTCTLLSCNTPNWKKAMDGPFWQTRNDPDPNALMAWGDPAYKTAACEILGTFTFYTSGNPIDQTPASLHGVAGLKSEDLFRNSPQTASPDDTVVSLMNTYITMYTSTFGTFRTTTTTTGTAVRSIGQTGFGK